MQVFTGIICDFWPHRWLPSPPRQLAASARCCLSWCSYCCWFYASVTHFLGTHLWLAIQKIFTQSSPGVNIFLASKTSSYRLQIGSDQFLLNIQTAIFGGMQLLEPKLRGDQQANQANPLDWGGVCFIAGMSFACLQPAHHAHHVWVRQTKRVTSWMIRTRGIAPGEKLHNDL